MAAITLSATWVPAGPSKRTQPSRSPGNRPFHGDVVNGPPRASELVRCATIVRAVSETTPTPDNPTPTPEPTLTPTNEGGGRRKLLLLGLGLVLVAAAG